MSGYIKIPDYDRDYETKDRELKKACGCTSNRLHPKERGVILACGEQGNTINVDDDIPDPDPPIEIVRVTIDPSVMCNPLVIIEFSSIIFSPSVELTEFTFALSKECENMDKREVKRVKFIAPEGRGATTDSYCFKFCDFNNNCTGGCCSYIVELVEATVSSTGSTISLGVITAEVQGACAE